MKTHHKTSILQVKELLGQGADPNITDNAGWYPLHELAISNKKDAIKIMKLLIDKGCELNTTASGLTPLHEAVASGHYKQVQMLLKAGASTEVRTVDDKGLVDLAGSNKEITKLILKYSNTKVRKYYKNIIFKVFKKKLKVVQK